MWRQIAVAPLFLTLAPSLCIVAAQSPDAGCRGSVDQKAIAGQIVDAETGMPMAGVSAALEARRPDTTFYSDSEVTRGIHVTPVFHRRAELDASGQFCFRDLRAGEYRFEPRAMRLDASHQAIVVHLEKPDTLKRITLRYRPFGRSPEEELLVARMLEELDANRRRWDQSKPRHYILRVKHGCGCLDGPPTTYEILDGVTVATIDSGGARHALILGARRMTVDSMFNVLRASLLDERQWVADARYDGRFGWPSHFRSGMNTIITDAWDEFTVERFDVIR